jgi:hypothetical protein
MRSRSKFRFEQVLRKRSTQPRLFGYMRGTGKIIGDIESPAWDQPWDAELGIAYRGENGVPVYYTENGIQTTDDL